MAKTLKEWLATDVAKVKDKPPRWLSENYFHREPNRSIVIDNAKFVSPADGVILFQERVKSINDPIIEVKGVNYSLLEATQGHIEEDTEFICIGIFMTFYSPHTNRLPYSGFFREEKLIPMQSYNFPMLSTEKDLLKGVVNPRTLATLDYLKYNEAKLGIVYAPKLGQHYYIDRRGDYDTHVILTYVDQGDTIKQGEKIGKITYGSQCNLYIPCSKKYDFEFIHEVGTVVEAGVDSIINIIPKNGRENKHFRNGQG